MVRWCHGMAAAAVAGAWRCLLLGLPQVSAQSVFLSEIHYDNSGADEGMFMDYSTVLLTVAGHVAPVKFSYSRTNDASRVLEVSLRTWSQYNIQPGTQLNCSNNDCCDHHQTHDCVNGRSARTFDGSIEYTV